MKTLYTLWALCLTSLASGQLPTNFDIYNFNLNDEFHYRSYEQGPPSARRIKVIDKYVSSGGDTIVYTFLENNYSTQFFANPEPHLVYSFHIDTTHLEVTDLYEPISLFEFGFSLDTTFGSLAECDIETIGFNYCTGDFEQECRRKMFSSGFGITDDYYLWTGAPQAMGAYMFYANKAGIVCGNPDLTSVSVINQGKASFQTFPNPTDGAFNIKRTRSDQALLIVKDLHGRMILALQVSGQLVQPKLPDLTNGIYLIELDGHTTKLIIQH